MKVVKPAVKKIPYNIDAVDVAFDITEMQPQLFVTPNYRHLTKVLEEFADSMALRTGGLSGLKKAIESKNTATAKYSSGLQVSGIFSKVIIDDNDDPLYIATSSPTALAWQDKQLIGHGKSYHHHGFSSPVGKLKNIKTSLEKIRIEDLAKIGVFPGEKAKLEFESGVIVEGVLSNIHRNRYGLNMIMTFNDCKVTYNGEILFDPSWEFTIWRWRKNCFCFFRPSRYCSF